jgi:hypothetical protein
MPSGPARVWADPSEVGRVPLAVMMASVRREPLAAAARFTRAR